MPERWDRRIAVLLTFWAVVLHLVYFLSAGALWRDEASSVGIARQSSWKELWDSLQHDSFPALYPAFLRLWGLSDWMGGDAGLRLSGLSIGILILAGLWIIAARSGVTAPCFSLVLFAINPVVIAEGDGIRPYGLSVLLMLASFACIGWYVINPRRTWIAAAVFSSTLAVQASYTNLAFLAACFIGALAAMPRLTAAKVRSLMLPCIAAGISLLPYWNTLAMIRSWAPISRTGCDWAQLLRDSIAIFGANLIPLCAGAIICVIMAAWGLVGTSRPPVIEESGPRAFGRYSAVVAFCALLFQILFLQLSDLRPFPRYFLPALAFAGIACDFLARTAGQSLRRVTILLVLLSTVLPAWSWVRLRRTNMEQVAAVLLRKASPEDLVIVSPWFLSPGFHRYYGGAAEWSTSPDLPHSAYTRYDLVKQAMRSGNSGHEITQAKLDEAVGRGGAIWFVSQRLQANVRVESLPAMPAAGRSPSGAEYVAFRRFWEDGILYLLQTCCVAELAPIPDGGTVWSEERLSLSRWEGR